MVKVVLANREFDLTKQEVEAMMRDVPPELLTKKHKHYVAIRKRQYPINQVVATATGVDRLSFDTREARRFLLKLGFEVKS